MKLENSRYANAQLGSLKPHLANPETEALVIGGILLGNGGLDRVLEEAKGFCTEVFTIDIYQEIYRAAIAVYKSSEPVDLMSISEWFRDHELLDKIGGYSTLTDLVGVTVSNANIDRQAKLLLKKYKMRCLVNIGYQMVDSDPSLTYEESLHQAINKLRQLEMDIEDKSFHNAEEMSLSLWNCITQGKLKGEKLGNEWIDFDNMTGGIFKPSLGILMAASSMGKTSWMVSMTDAALSKGYSVLFVSCEMSMEQINIRLLSRMTGIDSFRIVRGQDFDGIQRSEWTITSDKTVEIAEAKWSVLDHSSPTIAEIESAIKKTITLYGHIDIVFVDYIQMVRLDDSKKDRQRSRELEQISRELRHLANTYKCFVLVASQLPKEVGDRVNKRPRITDTYESSGIIHSADLVCGLYRQAHYAEKEQDKYDPILEVIVLKNKNGMCGTVYQEVDLSICTIHRVDQENPTRRI
ncbi:MAG: AAA family ATPase [Moorea sp. SIO3I7]|uniref:replicative DNA helicase n=1 Tax=Moorena sp. SIO3I8 TaxID=2607833 RepID=UPI0013BECCEF|nr:DnaB-like helicase C-terminal domain-containing protein [Moorena sp. SIO3I8]NEN95332.1 AAA family ATPase [Moorena sp. SIO3I7]NEO07394.1 AAA family ATPase [Moorena sp. SIO3I8]